MRIFNRTLLRLTGPVGIALVAAAAVIFLNGKSSTFVDYKSFLQSLASTLSEWCSILHFD
jgi:hypothetical protein